MRNRVATTLTVIVVMALGLFGCGGSDGESGSRRATEPKLPEVTVVQAEQAVSDAMLIAGLSLFLAFGAEEGATSVSNEEGSLTLSWDEDADFNTGAGLYTITLTDYAVPADDPFGADYNGYVLNGTVVMGSADGVSATLKLDLATSHEDSENYPVQTIDMEIEEIQNEAEQLPTGHVRINGHEMSLEDLAQAF
ncbi:MAG: hypothetical protein V3S41_02275 [Spirochaetia bacterium]